MLISVITVLSLGTVGMQAIFSYVSRDVMNALQAKDAARFHHLLMLFVVWIVAFVPIAAFYPYITGLLGIDWRDWMTETFVQGVLRRNALYHIMRDHRVDNPDQRISEDVNSFTSGALNYSMTVLQAIVTAATFFGILWMISRWLAVCLIGYALAGTWLAVVVGRRLVVINFNQHGSKQIIASPWCTRATMRKRSHCTRARAMRLINCAGALPRWSTISSSSSYGSVI